MKLIKLKKNELLGSKDAYRKVLYWFFAYPTIEISLNELIKSVNISKTTANKVVSRLVKEEFLKVQVIGKVWRISCNQQHNFNTTRKIPYHLELILNSEIVEEILKIIPNAKSIILFGSYRKGDDVDTSDLDLAVETLDNEREKLIPFGTISRLGYREKVKVNLLKFSRKKINLNLFANLVNGFVLYGFLEARP